MIPYSTSVQYMLAGYTAIFIVLALYIISLFVRWRKLKRNQQILIEAQRKR